MSEVRDADWGQHALAFFKGMTGDQKRAIAEILKDTPQGAQFVSLCYGAILPTLDEHNAHIRNTEGVAVARDIWNWMTRPEDPKK